MYVSNEQFRNILDVVSEKIQRIAIPGKYVVYRDHDEVILEDFVTHERLTINFYDLQR